MSPQELTKLTFYKKNLKNKSIYLQYNAILKCYAKIWHFRKKKIHASILNLVLNLTNVKFDVKFSTKYSIISNFSI